MQMVLVVVLLLQVGLKYTVYFSVTYFLVLSVFSSYNRSVIVQFLKGAEIK